MRRGKTEQRVFLGRYRAVRPLGEGGTSRVYLADDLEADRQVVVKVLHEELDANARVRDCFQREVLLLRRFQHPNAVALLDASLNDPLGPCLVVEHIDGIDLEELRQREGRLDPARAGGLLVQVCRVLQAAHAHGIIHRDLKPANLVVVDPGTSTEKVKVMDFGLSHLGASLYIPLEKLTRSGQECAAGTPEYISPEEVRRDPVDHRADLYSLGVILYQLLTGQLPFTGTVPELLAAHTDLSPPPFARHGVRIPAAIEGVVHSCLAKFPVERPQNARELAERYEQALGRRLIEEEDEVPPPVIVEPTPPAVGKHIDEHTVVRRLEAFMPEQIAAVKLRGFVQDSGGEAIESVPGLIRVRLGERQPAAAPPPTLWSWLGLGQKATPAPAAATEMELHMEKKAGSQKNVLQLTILLRPEGGGRQAADPQWQAFCDRVYRDLRAYLIGSG